MNSKISLRPIVATEPTENVSEAFQNTVLRPILKLQHDYFIQVFESYLQKRKQQFEQMAVEDRAKYIDHTLKTDQRFKQFLIGSVISLSTSDELSIYFENESELNRRLITMLTERLKSVFAVE
jgi:hypothetical protein